MKLQTFLIYTFCLVSATVLFYFNISNSNRCIELVTNQNANFLSSFQSNVAPENSLVGTAISANKMNVLYIGVDNPLTIIAGNTNAKDIKVTAVGATIKKTSRSSSYNVAAHKKGKATIIVENTMNHESQEFDFVVKSLPCPIVKLGNMSKGRRISSNELEAYQRLEVIRDTDFDISCQMISYTMVLTSVGRDDIYLKNMGEAFSKEAKELIQQAKKGDSIHIIDIKYNCPAMSDWACSSAQNFVFDII